MNKRLGSPTWLAMTNVSALGRLSSKIHSVTVTCLMRGPFGASGFVNPHLLMRNRI